MLDRLFAQSEFTAHGFCLAWDPGLIWLHAGSDLAIAMAYYSIPLALVGFVRRRRDVAFPWMFGLFAAFILLCGTTHVMGIVTLFVPLYWLDGTLMAVTALVSVATAIALWPLIPRALALPSPVVLERQIEERDRLAARLQASEARFRAFFEHMADLLFELDETATGEFCIVAANPALAAALGRPPDQLLGQTLGDALGDASGAALETACREAGRTAAPRQVETTLRAAEGAPLIVEALLVPLRDPATGRLRIMASLRDITERRALAGRLAQSQKMEAIGQITGGIAHDFNNILMGVSATLQVLQGETMAPDRRAIMVSGARQATERGGRMVRQLLAFARRQALAPAAEDVNAIIRSLVDDLLVHSLGGKVAVETALAPGLYPALVDRTQLEAALLNLAVNARDAMEDGGTLVFETTPFELAPNASPGSTTLPPGDYVRVRVVDTGSGMPADVAAQAFDPFFTTKPVGQGSGLGLSQVYGFARQSGGAVDLETRAGGGTTIVLTLPRAGIAPT